MLHPLRSTRTRNLRQFLLRGGGRGDVVARDNVCCQPGRRSNERGQRPRTIATPWGRRYFASVSFGAGTTGERRATKWSIVAFVCSGVSTHVVPFASIGRVNVARRYPRTIFPLIPRAFATVSGRAFGAERSAANGSTFSVCFAFGFVVMVPLSFGAANRRGKGIVATIERANASIERFYNVNSIERTFVRAVKHRGAQEFRRGSIAAIKLWPFGAGPDSLTLATTAWKI